jgi:peptidoglycan/LPS O-acetylase OafA/YrhL
MTRNESEPNILFIAFSLYTNGKKLFDITESKIPNSINCLNGIRALSIFWVIFGHRMEERFYVPLVNGDDMLHYRENPIYLLHTTFELAVDTFLLMGGLLATQSLIKALDRYKRIVFKLK